MNQNIAVIFDMDGVLVDSYHAHHRSWLAIVEPLGLSYTEEDFARTFGRTSREILAAAWGADRFSAAEIAALDDEKEAVFRRILAADFPAMPGARRLLEDLARAGLKLAVGSSGPPDNVDLVLEQLGAKHLFGATVTARDVTRGKPDPQVFLVAAARLGVPPERCAVVEDAPLGVAAANAAGMASIGLASTGRTVESLVAAELVVGSLGELSPQVVGDLIVRHARRVSASKTRFF